MSERGFEDIIKVSDSEKTETVTSIEEEPVTEEDFVAFEQSIQPSFLKIKEALELEDREHSPKIKEALKKAAQVVFHRILPLYMACLSYIAVTQKSEGSFSDKERAKKELTEQGITSERLSIYKPGLSEIVYRAVHPYTYNYGQNFNGFIERLVEGVEDEEQKGPRRYDAWRLYLGLPQKFNTFGISDYKPEQSIEDKYYYRLNDLKLEIPLYNIESLVEQIKGKGGSMIWNLGRIHNHSESAVKDVMRNFKLSLGSDEQGDYISYYDKWDLDVPVESNGAIGQPYEIYDRIYYDASTWKITNLKENI